VHRDTDGDQGAEACYDGEKRVPQVEPSDARATVIFRLASRTIPARPVVDLL
jgi:hypothetical protein